MGQEIDVGYVANLARIRLTDEEKELFQRQLDQVVGYVHQLDELELENIEPTAHAAPVFNVMRKDEPRPGLDQSVVLKNAPAVAQKQFLVPKILDSGS